MHDIPTLFQLILPSTVHLCCTFQWLQYNWATGFIPTVVREVLLLYRFVPPHGRLKIKQIFVAYYAIIPAVGTMPHPKLLYLLLSEGSILHPPPRCLEGTGVRRVFVSKGSRDHPLDSLSPNILAGNC